MWPCTSGVREAFDRLFRPTRNRHVLVLKPQGLAYVRIPKAANSSVKRALHRVAWPDRRVRKGGRPLNRDRYWLERAGAEVDLWPHPRLAAQAERYFVFTVVRSPFTRLTSCYQDKIVRRRELLPSFANMGFRKDMSFTQFAYHALSIPDCIADNHYRSQFDILSHRGRLVPEHVCRLERLSRDWPRLQRRVARRTGVILPRLPRLNQRESEDLEVVGPFEDRALVRAIRRRYERDFEVFYPALEDPTA